MEFLHQFSNWSTNENLEVSPQAIEDARHSFIDTIACILAGKKHSLSNKLKNYNKNFNAYNSIYGKALEYGAQSGILDFDDYEAAGSSHCSGPIVSSILSATLNNNFSYKRILESWIVGYEIINRLGLSLGYGHYEKGWHSSSTLGTIAVAAAVGRLLNVNKRVMLNSLSIASSSSAGMKLQFGNEMKVIHLGLAAQSGLQAVFLAKENIEANNNFFDFKDGFKDLYGTKYSKSLDHTLSLRKFGYATVDYPVIKKPWPTCSCTQRVIEASELLFKKIINIDDIKNVIIKTPIPFTKVSRFHIPNNEAEARFSPTYCVMITLLNGAIGPDDFMNDIFLSEKRQKLTNLAKVEPYSVPSSYTEMDPNYPCTVKINFKNGEKIEETISEVKGGVKRTMSVKDLKDKFLKCSDDIEFFDLLLSSNLKTSSNKIFKNLIN